MIFRSRMSMEDENQAKNYCDKSVIVLGSEGVKFDQNRPEPERIPGKPLKNQVE